MRKLALYQILFCSGILIAALAQGCKSPKEKISGSAHGKMPPAPAVSYYVTGPESVTEQINLAGSLLANEATAIFPEISGRLTYLNIAEGKPVAAGTLLAKIFDGDLKAQLHKLTTQLEVQEQTIKRYEELLRINGVSQQEYDLIKLQSNNLRADMEVVRSNIQRTEIRAPFSGVLGLKMISPGAYVSPQTQLTTIRQVSNLKVDFSVPEQFAPRISTGFTFNFTVEGSNEIYKARVIATESGISEADRSLPVRAEVIKGGPALKPGGFVKIKLAFDPNNNAIMIPSNAVIPQARGKQVALLQDGKITLRDITTGIRDSAKVQVLSGLEMNDTIITSGLMRMKEGSQVELKKNN